MTNVWTNEAGKPPSQKALSSARRLVRQGSMDCMVIAMAMRPSGVTQHEVISLFGKPHRNIIKKLVSSKQVRKLDLPEFAHGRRIKLVRR